MFTCRRYRKESHTAATAIYFFYSVCVCVSVCLSYIDNTLEVLQAVRQVLLKVVGFNGDSDAGTINCQVQLPKLFSGQGHC